MSRCCYCPAAAAAAAATVATDATDATDTKNANNFAANDVLPAVSWIFVIFNSLDWRQFQQKNSNRAEIYSPKLRLPWWCWWWWWRRWRRGRRWRRMIIIEKQTRPPPTLNLNSFLWGILGAKVALIGAPREGRCLSSSSSSSSGAARGGC